MLSRIIPGLLILTVCCTLASCGPVRGYSGPKLPDEQIALVTINGSGSSYREVTGYVVGQPFDDSGIQLLPGEHTFSVSAAFSGEPYDCRYEEDFNRWGYESCIRDRERAIEKNKSSIPYCDYDSYKTSTNTCQKDLSEYSCEIRAAVTAGSRYEIDVTQRGARRAEATFRGVSSPQGKTTSVNKRETCTFEGTRTEEVIL